MTRDFDEDQTDITLSTGLRMARPKPPPATTLEAYENPPRQVSLNLAPVNFVVALGAWFAITAVAYLLFRLDAPGSVIVGIEGSVVLYMIWAVIYDAGENGVGAALPHAVLVVALLGGYCALWHAGLTAASRYHLDPTTMRYVPQTVGFRRLGAYFDAFQLLVVVLYGIGRGGFAYLAAPRPAGYEMSDAMLKDEMAAERAEIEAHPRRSHP